MAEFRSASTAGGNLIWHSGSLRFDVQGETLRYSGHKVYTEYDKPDPHTDLTEPVVKLAGDTMTGRLNIHVADESIAWRVANTTNRGGQLAVPTGTNDPFVFSTSNSWMFKVDADETLHLADNGQVFSENGGRVLNSDNFGSIVGVDFVAKSGDLMTGPLTFDADNIGISIRDGANVGRSLWYHGNGNVSLSATQDELGSIGDLLLGYSGADYFTNNVRLASTLTTSDGATTIATVSGQLYDQGSRVFSPNNLNISDSVTGTSSAVYASELAVKTANDNANTKLPLAGGNLTGPVTSDSSVLTQTSATVDWNNAWRSGFYETEDAADGPTGTGKYFGATIGDSTNDVNNNNGMQIALSGDTGNLFFRRTSNGSGAWTQIASTADSDSRYVNITGDVMTGNLTAPKFISPFINVYSDGSEIGQAGDFRFNSQLLSFEGHDGIEWGAIAGGGGGEGAVAKIDYHIPVNQGDTTVSVPNVRLDDVDVIYNGKYLQRGVDYTDEFVTPNTVVTLVEPVTEDTDVVIVRGWSALDEFHSYVAVGDPTTGDVEIPGRLAVNKPLDVTDYELEWQSGFIQGNDALNGPSGVTGWLWGIQSGHGSNSDTYRYGMQLVIENNNDHRSYIRQKNGSGVGDWQQIATDLNPGTQVKNTNNGGSWISQKTSTYNNIIHSQQSDGSYYAWIQSTQSGNTFTVGSLGNNYFGFFGYDSATTANRTDYSARLDTSGNWTASGNVVAYSDRRLKTEITAIPDALDKVEQLTGYTYVRKDSGVRQTGLIAQELIEVLPEAVTYDQHEDTYAIAYGNVVGLLVESIKELRTEVQVLKQPWYKKTFNKIIGAFK